MSGEVQDRGQQIEERVVAGRGDQSLESGQDDERRLAKAPRPERQQRRRALRNQRQDGGIPLNPPRQVMRVPAERRRQRLGLLVVATGAEVAPGRIVRCELGHARFQLEAKREQAHQQPAASSEHGVQAGLEQQPIPLEPQKHPADRGERQIGAPGDGGRRARRDVEGERDAGELGPRGKAARARRPTDRATTGSVASRGPRAIRVLQVAGAACRARARAGREPAGCRASRRARAPARAMMRTRRSRSRPGHAAPAPDATARARTDFAEPAGRGFFPRDVAGGWWYGGAGRWCDRRRPRWTARPAQEPRAQTGAARETRAQQRTQHCRRTGIAPPVDIDQLGGNARIAPAHAIAPPHPQALERQVADARARAPAPAHNPAPAEPTIRVID